jgi:hypothetical protein
VGLSQSRAEPNSRLGLCSVSIYLYRYESPVALVAGDGSGRKVSLCFTGNDHYDAVYPLAWLDTAAICQGV